jgi:hypothetical protein
VTNVNRRSFLWQSSAGAAVLAALAVAPARLNPNTLPAAPVAAISSEALAEPLVAYVRNVAAGEIALLIGTREVVVRDAELVRRLLKAAG